LKNKLVILRNYFIFQWYDLLFKLKSDRFGTNPEGNFVVSIASYPQRDSLVPAVFQALSRQTVLPKKWILVLSEEEYPNGLPKHLQKLKRKGIEVLWANGNPYAVKKLVPVIEKYPELDVITFDDELLYGKKVIEKLIEESKLNEGQIIGHVGKVLFRKGDNLNMMFRLPYPADKSTPSSQIYFLGGSGTLYPANSLDAKVSDLKKISQIVPGRGSDIWFWAAGVAAGTKQVCLGTPTKKELYIEIPQNMHTKPRDLPGKEVMEERFQMAIDYFGIREKLLILLPDKIEEKGNKKN
jgi:hypothetical protein